VQRDHDLPLQYRPLRRGGWFRLWLPAFSRRSLLSPDHLCHCLKSVRRRRAAARQGREESAEQAGPVSHDPDPTDFNDETQQVETQSVRDIEDHTLYRRRHFAPPSAHWAWS
jgi:hypothetical protein